MQPISFPWYADIKRETNKLWIQDIKLLVKVELDLLPPYFNQTDINALATKLGTKNIEEPIDNFKCNKDSAQLFPETIKTLKERQKNEHLSWFEKKEIMKLLDLKMMTKQQIWTSFW